MVHLLLHLLFQLSQARDRSLLLLAIRAGTVSDIKRMIYSLSDYFGVSSKIEVSELKPEVFAPKADIVTNLGFVRPISDSLIRSLPKTAAIGLMWEPWEFRSDDINLESCSSHAIPVICTNEHHPNVATFKYVGILALKPLFEAQLEVLGLNILVIGSNPFGKCCLMYQSLGSNVFQIDPTKSWPSLNSLPLCFLMQL